MLAIVDVLGYRANKQGFSNQRDRAVWITVASLRFSNLLLVNACRMLMTRSRDRTRVANSGVAFCSTLANC